MDMDSEVMMGEDDQIDAGRTRCRNCGSYVTSTFARVFGDNHDIVYACLECSTMRALRDGSGVEQGS